MAKKPSLPLDEEEDELLDCGRTCSSFEVLACSSIAISLSCGVNGMGRCCCVFEDVNGIGSCCGGVCEDIFTCETLHYTMRARHQAH